MADPANPRALSDAEIFGCARDWFAVSKIANLKSSLDGKSSVVSQCSIVKEKASLDARNVYKMEI